MIIDTLEHLDRYLGLHENLDHAIRFIQKTPLHTLPVGRTSILGEEVFVNVSEGTTCSEQGRSYEYHKQYADLHLDLSGTEVMRISTQPPVADLGEFDSQNDGGFCEVAPPFVSVCLENTLFAMALPMEPHIPMIAVSEDAPIRKCVFKIRLR